MTGVWLSTEKFKMEGTGWPDAHEQIETEVEAWDQPACLELGGTDKIRGFHGPDVGHKQE